MPALSLDMVRNLHAVLHGSLAIGRSDALLWTTMLALTKQWNTVRQSIRAKRQPFCEVRFVPQIGPK